MDGVLRESIGVGEGKDGLEDTAWDMSLVGGDIEAGEGCVGAAVLALSDGTERTDGRADDLD